MSRDALTDFVETFAGQALGAGCYRTVYAIKGDRSRVIKVERSTTAFCNVQEWNLWQEMHGTGMEKWLAPCISISPCGRMLVQSRTTPIKFEELPKKIPSFFTDLVTYNWGWFAGRPVCHDYGNLLYDFNTTMKKAEWWKT